MDRIGERERECFAQRGLLRAPGLLPDATVAPLRERVWRKLEDLGLAKNGVWTAPRGPLPTKLHRQLRQLDRGAAFQALATPEARAAMSALVDGRPLEPTLGRAQLLFTAPDATEWRVPHNIWHLDFARLGEPGPPGLQIFAMLDRVEPGGGGTLVVAGSHRLLNDRGFLSSSTVKNRLKREAWFRDLTDARFPDRGRLVEAPGTVGEVPVQVVELHGEPGDVYFMDLRMLHTLAPNASDRPRLMATQRFVLEHAMRAAGEGFARRRDAKKERERAAS